MDVRSVESPGLGVRLRAILSDTVERQQPHIADGLAATVGVVSDVAQAPEDQLAHDDPLVLLDDGPRSGEGCQPLDDLSHAIEEVLDAFRLALCREPGSVASEVLNEVLVKADGPPPHSAGLSGARASATQVGLVTDQQIVERGLAGSAVQDRLRDRPRADPLPLLGP